MLTYRTSQQEFKEYVQKECLTCGIKGSSTPLIWLAKNIVKKVDDEIVRIADAGWYCRHDRPEVPRAHGCGCLYSFKDYHTIRYCKSCRKKYPKATVLVKRGKLNVEVKESTKKRRPGGIKLDQMSTQYT